MAQHTIAVFGDLLYDCFIWADRLPRVGETVTGYQNGFYAGGKGGNQAVALSRMGAQAKMLGKVGRDERGQFILNNLSANGVDTSGVLIDQNEATGTDCVHIDRKGRNAIIVAPMANRCIAPTEVDGMAEAIRGAQLLLTQLQVNLDAVQRAIHIAQAAGVPVILNPAPACEVPDSLLAVCDYVTPNETEAEFFTGVYRKGLALSDWCSRAAIRFHERGVRRLVITLGEHGAFYSDAAQSFVVAPYVVEALDTTAAGDAFNAAFALGLADGLNAAQAIRMGNAAGALAASRAGSMPSLPTAQAVSAFMKNAAVRAKFPCAP